jgi:exonuclease III
MQYVSWNCRGLRSKIKEESLRDLVCLSKPEVFLIQETKLEEIDLLHASNLFWEKGSGKVVSARGASGGIGTFWDTSKLDLIEEDCNTHWIFTKLLHKDSGHQVSLFNLYIPVFLSEKKTCWDSLKLFLSGNIIENIVIVGDLNVTLSISKKKWGSPVRDPAREWVEDLMLDWDLEDVKPARGKYT